MTDDTGYCTNCGAQMQIHDRFCVNCGAQRSPNNPGQLPRPALVGGNGMFEILGETFGLYKRDFPNLIAIVAVVKIPVAILVWLVFLTVDVPSEDDLNIGFFIDLGTKSLVVSIVGGIGWLLMQGALIHAISERRSERPIIFKDSYTVAINRFFPLLGALILAGLAVLLMAITIIGIPFAIAFGVFWLFVLQCTLLEGYGPKDAMLRSYKLVHGHWWWTFGFLIFSGILFGIIGAIITGILGLIIPEIGPLIGEILTAPLFIIAETLFFFELKSRQA